MPSNKKPTWVIHIVCNCVDRAPDIRPQMCDAHTHGLDSYGSRELQVVLRLEPELIGYILNSVGDMIREGLTLKDGDVISGLFEDPRTDIKIFETTDPAGALVLRLILPDSRFRFPEDSDEEPYCFQYESPYIEGRDGQCCENCTGLN